MESYVVQKWDASYYCWKSKIWKYGKLHLCPKYICFFEDNSQPNSALMITEDLRSITGFQRRLVSLIYKAIVVGVEGKDPLWFSSLQNREEVFYFLEHFWKQRLLCLGPGGETGSYGAASSLAGQAERQQFFKMLHDSEKTLIEASNTLYNQGEQFDNSSRMMNKMHKDLNVTETLIDGMDKWFMKWGVKPEQFYEIHTKREYPILYRKTKKECYYPGMLVFTKGQIAVLNIKRVADVSILLKDLTNIVVNTPWNVLLMRSAIGEVDVMIDISSAQVVYILKALEAEHGDKFHYEDVSDDAKQTIIIPSARSAVELVTENSDEIRDAELGNADLDAVGDIIGNMKSLAVGINQEMSRQFDSLDQLSESVDKANYRIKKSSKKVQKKLGDSS